MTTVMPTAQAATSRLSPAVHLAVREAGIEVPHRWGAAPLQLDYPRLVLLEALAGAGGRPPSELAAEVAEQTGADAEALEALIDELAARGLLVADGATSAPDPERASLVTPRTDGASLADWGSDVQLHVRAPLVLRAAPAPTAFDHDGSAVAELDARTLSALAAFGNPSTVVAALRAHRADAGRAALREREFASVVRELEDRGLLMRLADTGEIAGREKQRNEVRRALLKHWRLAAAVDRRLAELDAAEEERERRTGTRRVRVVPVHDHGAYVPLGLGMILAYLQTHDGGRLQERYQVRPDWVAGHRSVEELGAAPAVYLFSNYMWSARNNLACSARIKAHSPGSLTIHGGPETPKYQGDVEDFFAANPHVDVAIHGEGEVTTAEVLAALADQLGGDAPLDLSVLRDVPGLSFRLGDEVVRTESRPRLEDLNVIPSPYLTGLFDAYAEMPGLFVTLESNRGCPYGCTFCDWGTVTMARIRKLDLDRVLGELDWCARNGALMVGFADANFGIFARDVEIAEHVVGLKQHYGMPQAVGASYAKNTVKHLEKIVTAWIDAGIATTGVLSLQTMDPGTLDAVHRSNIKTEKYDQLARTFRDRRLPLYIDLMVGLPGSTLASFSDDVQGCIDREVQVKLHPTSVLVNSPMNDPAYRAEYGIEVDEAHDDEGRRLPRSLPLVATSSMGRAELAELESFRQLFLACENFGVLRHVVRYVRHETGEREIDLYHRLWMAARESPERWPAIDFLAGTLEHLMAPPASWQLLIEDVRAFVLETTDVPDDDALATVLAAQHAVLPSPGRRFPVVLDLPHDVVSWHQQMLVAKDEEGVWTERVPHLRDLPPGRLVVEDPREVTTKRMGGYLDRSMLDNWELESGLTRPYFDYSTIEV